MNRTVIGMIRELRDAGSHRAERAPYGSGWGPADTSRCCTRGGVLRGTIAEIRAASGMGQRLDVTFAGPVGPESLNGLPGGTGAVPHEQLCPPALSWTRSSTVCCMNSPAALRSATRTDTPTLRRSTSRPSAEVPREPL